MASKFVEETAQQNEIENPKDELIKLDFGCTEFTSPTSGKKYFVERNIEELSIRRYEMLEKMLTEMQYSMTHEEIQNHLVTQAKSLKENDLFMASVINYNLQTGLADMNSKHAITFWICTVFIYREDEKSKTWDSQLAQQKIDDWCDNYQAGFFLHLRDTMYNALISYCEHISQAFSEYPLNPTFTENRIQRLKLKYPLSQNNEQ